MNEKALDQQMMRQRIPAKDMKKRLIPVSRTPSSHISMSRECTSPVLCVEDWSCCPADSFVFGRYCDPSFRCFHCHARRQVWVDCVFEFIMKRSDREINKKMKNKRSKHKKERMKDKVLHHHVLHAVSQWERRRLSPNITWDPDSITRHNTCRHNMLTSWFPGTETLILVLMSSLEDCLMSEGLLVSLIKNHVIMDNQR